MGKQTNIAWTESTLNLAWGCTKVSRECTQCYMYRLSERFGKNPYNVILTKAGLDIGATGERAIAQSGEYIFVNSMSDTFHKDIPNDYLDAWFHSFEGHVAHQFQILTKRPERALEYFGTRHVPLNCWIGTSIGINEAKHRIDILRKIDARIRFVSFEPLLEDLGQLDLTGIHWAIIGGESDDQNPREMKPEWAESIIKQCREQNVAVFFKQMGGKGGSGAGGDLINGRRIQEMPKVAAAEEAESG